VCDIYVKGKRVSIRKALYTKDFRTFGFEAHCIKIVILSVRGNKSIKAFLIVK
jgi:hypothetical protein